MDVDPPYASQPQQPYAIVRIKRKRNEEPLDALGEYSHLPQDHQRPHRVISCSRRRRSEQEEVPGWVECVSVCWDSGGSGVE